MTYPPCNLLIPDWYRGTQGDSPDTLTDRFIKNSEFLVIDKVNQTHAGSYFVTMENDIGLGIVDRTKYFANNFVSIRPFDFKPAKLTDHTV